MPQRLRKSPNRSEVPDLASVEGTADFVFRGHVDKMLAEIKLTNPRSRKVQRGPAE